MPRPALSSIIADSGFPVLCGHSMRGENSMFLRFSFAAVATFCAAQTLAAEPKAELIAAVNKLADSANYSWSTKVEGGYFGGVGEGKTEKDGATRIAVN